jgi:hypothetical protein
MTLREQLSHLFALHTGPLTLTLHLVSLPLIFAGLGLHRVSLIVLGGVLELIGHIYDYTRRFDREQRRKARIVLPLQLGATVATFVLLLKLFRWF